MPANPTYTGDPVSASVAISTANTNRDGSTGTYGTAYTFRSSGANGGKGGRIDAVYVQATGTTTAGMVRMFVNTALVREFAISALTPSGTVKAFTIPTTDGADVNGRCPLGIVCQAGDIIKFNTHNAEAFVVRVDGGEF
jgi:hypothetical protein